MLSMQSYVIITDSTADLSQKMIEEMGVDVKRMTYSMDGEEFSDIPVERDDKIKQFYAALRSGSRSFTSQINMDVFTESFKSYLEQGKDVLYIGFSSALSGTCSQAVAAANKLKLHYPDRKIFAVDSLCASLGQGLLVYYAAQLQKNGAAIEDTVSFLEKNKLHLCHWFTVDDLNHLKRGGRVSATVALLGTVLGIKPILHVDDEGRLIPMGKVRGRRASLDELVKKAEQTMMHPEDQTVFISHGDCIDDAEYVADKVKEKLHVKDVKINYIGPVIGSHSGPGTVALFFMGTKR